MNRSIIRLSAVGVFCVVAMVARAEADHPGAEPGPNHAARTISALIETRSATAPQDSVPHTGKVVQFVERTRFSEMERKQLAALHQQLVAAAQVPLPAETACPLAQRLAQHILDRLIEGSRLRQVIQEADFPVHVVVTCGVANFPDAEIRAGVLAISAELILAMSSEDEIAAMMGHELGHYVLAHEAQKLQTHRRLTQRAARMQSIRHEFEADAEGLILLANAGYDPHAAIDVLKSIRAIVRDRGWQSGEGHPDIGERIRRLTQDLSHAGLSQTPRRTVGLAAIHDELKSRPRALLKKREATALPF